MKLRIAFLTAESVTEGAFDGGLANYLNRITKGFMSRGHEVEVFSISNKNETIENNGIKIHRIIPEAKWYSFTSRFFRKKLSSFRWLFLESYCLYKKFIERHKEKPFDIVQVPSYRASGLSIVLRNKLPITTRISSYRKLSNETHGKERNLDVRLEEWLEEVVIRRVCRSYAPSKYLADKISSTLHRKIDVLKPSFFIDLDRSRYDDEFYAKNLKEKKYILFFGGINKLKGIFILLEALKKVFKENSQINVVFIGEDVPYKNRNCMEIVKQELSEYLNRIYYFKPLPHAILYPVLMNSEIVVIPSLVDNIPNTCLEAMAHGCVIVASDGASLDELIENGKSGFLFKLGDPDSLAEKLLLAWNLSQEERERISANAKKAIEKLAPEIAVKELEDYYVKTIEEWKKNKL
ncbi:MAG: glycosyltransferase family 4 protein [bacterium]